MFCYFFKTLKHPQDSNISPQKLIESVVWLIPHVIIFIKMAKKLKRKQIIFLFSSFDNILMSLLSSKVKTNFFPFLGDKQGYLMLLKRTPDF